MEKKKKLKTSESLWSRYVDIQPIQEGAVSNRTMSGHDHQK